MIVNGEVDIIVNTASDPQSLADSYAIRRQALQHKVTFYTTLAAARAACQGHRVADAVRVSRLQDLHRELLTGTSSAA